MTDARTADRAREDLLALLLAEEGVDTAQEGIPRREEPGPAPLSFPQERLWFLDRLEPGNAVYHVHTSVLLEGPLDLPATARTFRAVAGRHEVLRTRFPTVEGRPVQVVDEEARVPFAVIDVTVLEGRESAEAAARAALAEAFAQPFDLGHGPLLRVFVVRFAADRHAVGIVMHHAVSDRWSREIFVSEIATFYRAFVRGEEAVLPPLPIQYGDFATWQRTWLTGPVLEEQVEYWRARLTGVPNLELPTDRPRPTVQDHRGGRLPVALPRDAAESLRRWAESRDATFFMALSTLFFAFLHRHTGHDDLSIGSPIANRTRPELENLVGYFVNTLVLRVPVSGSDRFGDVLDRVREAAVGAYGHQDLPFERLLDELEVERGLSRTPLFQAALVLQNVPRRGHRFADIDLRPFPVHDRTAKFDLTLTFEDSPTGLEGSVEYAAALFDRTTVERMIHRFGDLLAAVARDPETPIADLPLLAPAERHQLVAEWGVPVAEPVSGREVLPEIFRRRAEEAPDAPAVTHGGATLSYGELAARARRLATRLRRAGVGPEVRVALRMDPSLDLVVGLLAILEAGGAYVPVDPSLPAERLTFIQSDSGVRVLLTDREPEALAEGVEVVRGDRLAEEGVSLAAWETGPAAEPSNAAYVIYTSGSTGRPKGVVVTHENVVRLFRATEEELPFGADDVWTLFHSFAFDFSVWEIWGALAHGGRLVVVPPLVARGPSDVRRLLRAERVTVFNQTPSAFRLLVGADVAAAGREPYALRFVVFGGESLELESLRPWFERHGDAAPVLVNMYGITETTVHVTLRPLVRGDLAAAHRSPVGRPIRDLGLHVLDASGRPAPIGVPGEMHVSGAGLARGYLGRPGLTAERFVPDPFSGAPGARLYCSGDLGRTVHDGEVDHLGRVDDQVKIRGFRIELGEVQAALASHPEVRESVVRAVTQGDGEARLVGYFVAAAESAPGAERLRTHMLSKLPSYMVPASFVSVPAIPLTGNGKVDFARLPLPEGDRSDLEAAYVAPRTPREEVLASIWRKVLGVERVGVHDNFFVLGGDSIQAVRVLSVAEDLGVELSLQQLFQAQTIAELAIELDRTESSGESAVGPAPAGRPGPFELVAAADRERLPERLADAYPLTNLQAGMLYHMQMEPDRPVYHNVNSFHLRLPFDEGAFRRAANLVVARHPILRTSFDLHGFREPLQLVHREAEVDLGTGDLRHLDSEAQEAALAELVREEAERRFDPSKPPLIRFQAHRRTDETFQLTLTEFHPILDGWSLQSTLAEIFGHYVALLEGGTPESRPPVAATLRDYVHLERQAARSEASREFWTHWLADAPFTELPPRGEVSDAAADGGEGQDAEPPRVERPATPIPPELSERLRAVAREAGVPIKAVLLAAHLKVLSVLAGSDDVVGGLASHGRPEIEGGDEVRGLFLNTLPFRFRLAPGTWRELIDRAFEAEMELLPHRRYPLVSMQAGGGGQALFDTQFNYVHFHVLRDAFGTREVVVQETDHLNVEETHFAIVAGFGSDAVSERVYLHLYTDRERFTEEQTAAIARSYLTTLAAIAEHPDARHEDLVLLRPAEVSRVRLDALDPDTSVADVSARIGGWARALPGSTAVVRGDDALTFAELDARVAEAAGRGAGKGEPEAADGALRPSDLVASLGALRAGRGVTPPDAGGPGAEGPVATRAEVGAVLDTLQALAPLSPTERVAAVGTVATWRDAWPALLWPAAAGAPAVLARLDRPWSREPKAPTTALCPASEAPALARALGEVAASERPRRALFFGRAAVAAGLRRHLTETLGVEALSVVRLPGGGWNLAVASASPGRATLRPLAGHETREVAVLGPFDQPVPRGVLGELAIGGERTGHRARLARPGELELLEPVGESVSIIGRRVELVRIAHELSSLPGVAEAVAAVSSADGPRPRLTAWAAPLPGAELDPPALLRALRSRLQPPSVPAAVETIDRVPRYPDGTPDRSRLPTPTLSPAEEQQGLAPRNELERTILDVWHEVLGTGEVGVRDNFFDLGGHSLQMLQAHQKLQVALDRQIPLMSHFRFPTVESLAEFLSGETADPEFEDREERGQARAAAMQRRRNLRRNRRDRTDDAEQERDNPHTGVP